MYTENKPNNDKKIIIENKVNCGCCSKHDDDFEREAACAYLYLLIPGGITVAAGADVPLNNAGSLENIGFAAPQAVIGITGNYEIYYGLNVATAQSGLSHFAIAVNGVPLAATFIPLLAGAAGEFSGNAILALNKNDVVSIRNVPGSSAIILSGSPSVGAQLTIHRVG